MKYKKGERMESIIVAIIILAVVGTAIFYIVKEKRKGTVCIGCPHAGTCASKKNENSQCNCK